MRRKEANFASPDVLAAGQHLGALVRQARLARVWTQRELAERSRIGFATLKRIEGGAVETSLGGWLAVLEVLGLLPLVTKLRDTTSEALLDSTLAKRSRRQHDDGLDF